jgi:hypothetical protein
MIICLSLSTLTFASQDNDDYIMQLLGDISKNPTLDDNIPELPASDSILFLLESMSNPQLKTDNDHATSSVHTLQSIKKDPISTPSESLNTSKAQPKTDNDHATSSVPTVKKMKKKSENMKSKIRKKYLCDSCKDERDWGCSSKLERHARTHSSDRPFTCPVEGCDRTGFTQKGSVKTHIVNSSSHRNLSQGQKEAALALLSKQKAN